MKYLQRLSTEKLDELMELLQFKRHPSHKVEYYDYSGYIDCEIRNQTVWYKFTLYDFYCCGKNAHVDAMYNRQKLFYDYMVKQFGEEYKKDYDNFYKQKYLKNPTYLKVFGDDLKSVTNGLKQAKGKEVKILIEDNNDMTM